MGGSDELAGASVLVVEDHEFQRYAIVEVLASIGVADVFEAADGQAALSILDRVPHIDLILCDLDMPGMDGVQFVRSIGERRLRSGLLVTSALDPDLLGAVEAIARAYDARFLGAVPKPLSLAQIADALAEVSSPARTKVSRNLDEEALREALEQRNVDVHFQPIVAIAGGELLSLEALLRWPRSRPTDAATVVGAAERMGLALGLTEAVIAAVCRARRQLLDAGIGARTAINLSPACMDDVSLVERVLAIVAEQGAQPHHIIFEVTETAVGADNRTGLEILTRLRMHGFRLSIDDFGTGYSTHSLLSQVPFSELKVDQSFVRGATATPRHHAIVRSSIELGHRLGLRVVGEGCETEAEWAMLAELGCDQAQGYGIARPMPVGDVPTWHEQWTPPVPRSLV
jgi:EAL domain-containing protein (putative c-di-GMP-specific phosphodiesterase class I)